MNNALTNYKFIEIVTLDSPYTNIMNNSYTQITFENVVNSKLNLCFESGNQAMEFLNRFGPNYENIKNIMEVYNKYNI